MDEASPAQEKSNIRRRSSDLGSVTISDTAIRQVVTRRKSRGLIRPETDTPPDELQAPRGDGEDALYGDTRAVICLRIMVVLVLFVAATVVGAFTFTYISNSETHEFHSQYYDSVIKVAEGFQNGIDTKVWAARTFSALYTSRYGPVNDWPNVTMPGFQEQAYGQLKLSDGRALSFNPIINETSREPWEAHAAENVKILDAPFLVERACEACRIVADGIFMIGGVDDTGLAPGSRYNTTMVPVWKIDPIEGN